MKLMGEKKFVDPVNVGIFFFDILGGDLDE